MLVVFGCGSVAVTILFSAHAGLFQVAAIWGLGVTLAIYATRHLSCAHLNSAVSIAIVGGRMSIKRLPAYLAAQFIGAFMAAGILYLLFSSSLANYESVHGIIRGTPNSVTTAMMFGEFYPNPGAGPSASVIFDRYLKPVMRNKMNFPSCTCDGKVEEVSRHEDINGKS